MQSADPDVPQHPNKCHQETKTLPLPLYSLLTVGPRISRPVQLGARALHGILPPPWRLRILPFALSPPVFAPSLPPPRKGQPYFNDVIGIKARARARVEGWRGRATCKVLCRGAPELAGFTRAVTKHLLSLAAVPRSRLPQARLPLVCYCLFFHRLLSSSFSPSSSSCSSCSTLPHLPPLGPTSSLVLVSRRFHMEARPHCSKSRPSACVYLLLRLFTKRYSRYPFRQDSLMSEILVVVQSGHCNHNPGVGRK